MNTYMGSGAQQKQVAADAKAAAGSETEATSMEQTVGSSKASAEDAKKAESEEEEESSYYDTEEESEGEKDEPKTQEIIDLSGNIDDKKAQEMQAQQIFNEAKKKEEA